MTQRIQDRLNSVTGDDEILVRAYNTGEYIDQFTTIPPEDAKVTLERLPKCMQRKEDLYIVKDIY